MMQYVVGHRGAAGLAPENTIKAFRLGCESGADVVECDIHLTKDKKLVVIHDGTVDRTTNGSGWVKDYTFEDLRNLDAGDGEKIPTLEEVIAVVDQYNKRLIIEIKAEDMDAGRELASALALFLANHRELFPRICVHSFWQEIVKQMKDTFSDLQVFLIIWVGLEPEKMLQLVLDAHADGASIEQDHTSTELVALMHERGLKVDAFLLNNPMEFERMKERGVDGLITNFPNKFKLS